MLLEKGQCLVVAAHLSLAILVIASLGFVAPVIWSSFHLAFADSPLPFSIGTLGSFGNELTSLFYTVSFAALSSILTVFCGLLISLRLRSYTDTALIWLIAFCLLPTLIGSGSWSFLLNNIPFSIRWGGDGNAIKCLTLMVFAQVWQYASLAAFVLWMNLWLISPERINFSKSAHLSSEETTLYVAWPQIKDLVLLLTLLLFFMASSDMAKSAILIHGSPGLGTEVINGTLFHAWLTHRNFGADAAYYALTLSSAAWLCLLIFGFCWAFLSRWIILSFLRGLVRLGGAFALLIVPVRTRKVAIILAICLVAFSLLPLFVPFRYFAVESVDFHEVLKALDSIEHSWIPTVVAAILISGFSIAISVWLRWRLPHRMGSVADGAKPVIFAYLTVIALPPVAVGLCAFWWYGTVMRAIDIAGFWWLGLFVTLAPVLLIFLTFIHFDIEESEILFLKANNVDLQSTFGRVFLKRATFGYLLVLLFSLSLVWNECAVTQVVSGNIEPGGYDLYSHATSRSVNLSYGYTLVAIPLLVALLACAIIAKLAEKTLRQARR